MVLIENVYNCCYSFMLKTIWLNILVKNCFHLHKNSFYIVVLGNNGVSLWLVSLTLYHLHRWISSYQLFWSINHKKIHQCSQVMTRGSFGWGWRRGIVTRLNNYIKLDLRIMKQLNVLSIWRISWVTWIYDDLDDLYMQQALIIEIIMFSGGCRIWSLACIWLHIWLTLASRLNYSKGSCWCIWLTWRVYFWGLWLFGFHLLVISNWFG